MSRLLGKQRQGKAVRNRFLSQGQCHCNPISGLLFSKLESSLAGSGFSSLSESFWVADGGLVIVILSEMEVREENNVEKPSLKDGCVSFSLAKGPTYSMPLCSAPMDNNLMAPQLMKHESAQHRKSHTTYLCLTSLNNVTVVTLTVRFCGHLQVHTASDWNKS